MAGERRLWRPALALLCAGSWRQGACLKAFLKQPSDSRSFEDVLLGPAPSTASVAPSPQASADPDEAEGQISKQFHLGVRGDARAASGSDAVIKNLANAVGTGAAAGASASSAEQWVNEIAAKLKDRIGRGRAGEAAGGAANSGQAAQQTRAKEAASASSSSTASGQRGTHIKVDFKDLFGLGGTDEAAAALGGQSKSTQEQEEAAESAEMFEHLGLMKEALGVAKATRAGSSHQEGQELGSLKAHLGEMRKATKSLMGGLLNASSPGHALQDIAQRHRNERERRRRLNLQRQLLRGTPLIRNEGDPALRRMDDEDSEDRPMSLLALHRRDARVGEPEPARERFRASRERLLSKLAAGRVAAASNSTPAAPGSAAASNSTPPAPVSAASEAEGEAEEEEEEDDGLDENGQQKSGHGEILAKVFSRLQNGARQAGKSVSKDVMAAVQNIAETEDREHGDPKFFVNPAGKVQVVTDKIHRLTDFFAGGLRSMAHNASHAVGKKKGLEDILLDGIRIHQTPNTGQ